MNREYEVNPDIFVIKYSIFIKLLDKYRMDCSSEDDKRLTEALDLLGQDLSAYAEDTDEYKINYYKKCLSYAKNIGKSVDDVIVMSLGIIEDEIIPVYLDSEEAKIRYEEFIEDINRTDEKPRSLR